MTNIELKMADSRMHDRNLEGLCWSSTQTHILEMLLDGILNEHEHLFYWASRYKKARYVLESMHEGKRN